MLAVIIIFNVLGLATFAGLFAHVTRRERVARAQALQACRTQVAEISRKGRELQQNLDRDLCSADGRDTEEIVNSFVAQREDMLPGRAERLGAWTNADLLVWGKSELRRKREDIQERVRARLWWIALSTAALMFVVNAGVFFGLSS